MPAFDALKKRALEKLASAEREGKTDKAVLRLVRFLNAQQDVFTSSSCYGRVMLIDFAGRKGKANIKAKWHRPARLAEVRRALRAVRGEQVWLRAEPFILHVSCRNLQAAEKVLAAKNRAGIKRGGLFTLSRRIQAELQGTRFMESLVKARNKILVDDALLKKLARVANQRFRENARDIRRLEQELRRAFKQ